MPGADRQRDLLPLRLPAAEGGVQCADLSRGTRQRILRRLAADAGFSAPMGSQASALEGLAEKYRQAGPPPQSRPEEALRALLGSMSVYSLDNIECNIASFDEALVSWPEPGSHPVRITELAGTPELLADSGAQSLCTPVSSEALHRSSASALACTYG